MNVLMMTLVLMILAGFGVLFFTWKMKNQGGHFISVKNQYFVSSREKFILLTWNKKEFLCFVGPNTFQVIDNKKLVKNDVFEKVLAENCTL